jgi:hypothetical protein
MIAILTTEQKDQLVGQTYDGVCFYNPIQDLNDNWIISEEEINQSDLAWLKELTLEEFQPKPVVNPFDGEQPQ